MPCCCWTDLYNEQERLKLQILEDRCLFSHLTSPPTQPPSFFFPSLIGNALSKVSWSTCVLIHLQLASCYHNYCPVWLRGYHCSHNCLLLACSLSLLQNLPFPSLHLHSDQGGCVELKTRSCQCDHCMYVCMYVRMYACTYVRMHARTYACMYVCTYVCMEGYISMLTFYLVLSQPNNPHLLMLNLYLSI